MKKLVLIGLFLGLCGKANASFWPAGGDDYFKDAGSMFYCASTGTVLTTAGVSVSSPSISIYNPINSGKNLTLLEVGIDVLASPAAATGYVLAYNVTPSSGIQALTGATGNMTAALVGTSTSTATTNSIAKCNAQGILPATPIAFRFLGGTTGASAIGGVVFTDHTDGKVVIPPGGLVSLQATAASQIQAHFLWREDPQ